MYPILYQRKSKRRFLLGLLLLALCTRVACASEWRAAVWMQTRAALGSAALLRGAGVALETRTPAELDLSPAALAAWSGVLLENRRADDFGPVSYTHLTLPTNREV